MNRIITPTTGQLRMLATIKGKEWLILESQLPKFALSALDASSRSESIDYDIEDFFELRPESTFDPVTGIATIWIHSVLLDSCPKIYEKLGLATCYSTIIADISFAIESGAKGILFCADSPGGTVSGCIEAATVISNLQIPSVAFCKSLACSAAYKLISGCTQIVTSPSALIGNIGSIIAWQDCTEFWAEMGIEFKALTSEGAELKSTFHLEPNETQVEFLQDSINESGLSFREHVIQGRTAAGATLDEEVFRAGWYAGDNAVALGLADGVGTIDDAKNALIQILQEK